MIGAGGSVDVGGVALALGIALAFYIVFVLEATGALKLRVVGGEVDFETVVAASGATEDEVVDEERAVRLGVGTLAAAVVFAAGCGGGGGGGKARGTEGNDSRGPHVCRGLLF